MRALLVVSADDRAVKSFAMQGALPLQTSISFDGKMLFARDESGAVRHWSALP